MLQHLPSSCLSLRDRDHFLSVLGSQDIFPRNGNRAAFLEMIFPFRKLMSQLREAEIFELPVTFAHSVQLLHFAFGQLPAPRLFPEEDLVTLRLNAIGPLVRISRLAHNQVEYSAKDGSIFHGANPIASERPARFGQQLPISDIQQL